MADKIYAMSSFLQFRTVYDPTVKFSKNLELPRRMDAGFSKNRKPINTADELYEHVKTFVETQTADGKTALALSSGIDSAICAAFMPKGSTAYTFRCVVPGKNVTDETNTAKYYCEANGLEHVIVDVYWEDYEQLAPVLFEHIHAPFHSIDVQIYKAATQAKKDGCEKMLFGQGADLVFGGFDKLLSKDWTIGDFVERYSLVMPYRALKNSVVITEPFKKWAKDDGYIDLHGFLDEHLFWEDIHSYHNSCSAAGIEFAGAYLDCVHMPLDYKRVRNGENKYLVREVFNRLYPDLTVPGKIPMPRPMTEWLENWGGPTRPEFWPNCHLNMSGDQKYAVWILERFFDCMLPYYSQQPALPLCCPPQYMLYK